LTTLSKTYYVEENAVTTMGERETTAFLSGEPYISVGIMDHQRDLAGCLSGSFSAHGIGPLSGPFRATNGEHGIALVNGEGHGLARAPSFRLVAEKASTATLHRVTIGNQFHWERAQDQVFRGNLLLRTRDDGTFCVINEISLEDYLESVISSEMSGEAPFEFLRAHAVMSRSWLIAALNRKKAGGDGRAAGGEGGGPGAIERWYDREDHDIFDVCADDHCQRYQGITKAGSTRAAEAVRETRGVVITYGGEVCDARYSKACGGITEDFATAWADKTIPYLASLSDSTTLHAPVRTEAHARRWVLSRPEAYCNTDDPAVLEQILPDFDRETEDFFRWKIDYARPTLEEIVRKKSGIDFGTLLALEPLRRGPSGRIRQLRIVGSKEMVVVGKELEIRRWLSESHLYSSAFIVDARYGGRGIPDRFTLYGAGWGHGVGLCQIGAAIMATNGLSAEAILGHYFHGTAIERIY
jgi:peptidoglycan hydrolase-like amidase